MNVIDSEAMNGAIKLRWLQNFMKHEQYLWFVFPAYLFRMVGGIHFLLRCDFDYPLNYLIIICRCYYAL